MARLNHRSKGNNTFVLTNHFKVNDGRHFLHYCPSFVKTVAQYLVRVLEEKVIDKVHDTYSSELDGKKFVYDEEKSLFIVGALPSNKLEFTVILKDVTFNRNKGNTSPDCHDSLNEHDKKRLRRPYQSKTFKVEISFAAKIPMQAIQNALCGQESEDSQEALRVLDIILHQHTAK
ncbi:hypothetical protein REPUB_Repub04eG0147500 [Reevesia pubescens]